MSHAHTRTHTRTLRYVPRLHGTRGLLPEAALRVLGEPRIHTHIHTRAHTHTHTHTHTRAHPTLTHTHNHAHPILTHIRAHPTFTHAHHTHTRTHVRLVGSTRSGLCLLHQHCVSHAYAQSHTFTPPLHTGAHTHAQAHVCPQTRTLTQTRTRIIRHARTCQSTGWHQAPLMHRLLNPMQHSASRFESDTSSVLQNRHLAALSETT